MRRRNNEDFLVTWNKILCKEYTRRAYEKLDHQGKPSSAKSSVNYLALFLAFYGTSSLYRPSNGKHISLWHSLCVVTRCLTHVYPVWIQLYSRWRNKCEFIISREKENLDIHSIVCHSKSMIAWHQRLHPFQWSLRSYFPKILIIHRS
jgi:hypothetical protein